MLCGAQLPRLAERVAAAKHDYRDVPMGAEYPAEGQALWALRADLSEDQGRRLGELRQRDRQQYQDWLKE